MLPLDCKLLLAAQVQNVFEIFVLRGLAPNLAKLNAMAIPSWPFHFLRFFFQLFPPLNAFNKRSNCFFWRGFARLFVRLFLCNFYIFLYTFTLYISWFLLTLSHFDVLMRCSFGTALPATHSDCYSWGFYLWDLYIGCGVISGWRGGWNLGMGDLADSMSFSTSPSAEFFFPENSKSRDTESKIWMMCSQISNCYSPPPSSC